MRTFLQDKIELIYALHAGSLDKITLVIPNKRGAVYIQKYFAELSTKPFFAPKIITINEWISANTPQRIVSQTELVFILFEIHKLIEKEAAEDFNSFIKWGKIILNDFDEIDRYLVPPKLIFTDLRNIKEIENWSFLEEHLSNGQEKFKTLWDKLPDYYNLLAQHLESVHLISQGAAYKQFYNQLIKKDSVVELSEHYYFIGFNALSISEEGIINYLRKEKKATVYFDMDETYIQNSVHEAGHFYRKIVDKWQIKRECGQEFNRIPKKFTVIETAQQIGQAKIAGSILSDLLEQGIDLDSTAIVLADESLLIPLSRSLPAKIERANITMGYPLKFSHLKGLIDIVFEIQFNFQKFNSNRIYHKSLLNYLDHPYLAILIENQKSIALFEKEVIDKNKIFIEQEELFAHFPELKKIEALFIKWKNPIKEGFVAFKQLTADLYEALKSGPASRQIDLEIIYHFVKGFNTFDEITQNYPHELNLKSFKVLFYQFWQAESLSFLGNPTEGVQVMGILETRSLDFENLLILGMNEGNLPQTNPTISFIPRDLKLNHSLPVEEDRQAIFAHHFYCLLHRAKNVYFTFNSTTEGVGTSEKSRFITQLENEIDASAGHTIAHFTYTSDDIGTEISTTRYLSSPAVQAKMDERFSVGLSPSALNKLISCPLDFYYRYILGMKENSVVEENIESSTFGTKIHEVLERIFRVNFLEKKVKLDAQVLQAERKNVEAYLKEAYLKEFSENDIKFGQNKLSFEVSLGFIDRFLGKQIDEIKSTDAPIRLIDLEKKFSVTYQWKINGEEKTIQLEGNADRIDQFGSYYRIIDYKSGKCTEAKVKLGDKILQPGEMEKFMNKDDKGYGRQLLMYALMFRATYPEYKQFTAGIISMINLDDWLQNVCVNSQDSPILTDEILDAFEEELKFTLAQLYESGYCFEHNKAAKYCENCDV